MADQDVTSYLQNVPTDNDTKAQAWEVFNHPANQQDFEQRIGKLNLPQAAKADMWEAKYGSGKWNTSQAVPPPVTPPPKPAPSAGQGFFRSAIEPVVGMAKGLLDWAPTEDEKKRGLTTPFDYAMRLPERFYLGQEEQGKQAVEAAKAGNYSQMVGHGLAAVTPAVGPWAASVGEQVGGELGAGNYKQAAGTILGNAAIAAAPKVVEGARGMIRPTEPLTPSHETPLYSSVTPEGRPSMEPVPPAPPPGVSPTAPAPYPTGAARVAQAVGKPSTFEVRTVHVDPGMADEITDWQNSGLPQKRVIIRSRADGTQTLRLAHTDPDVSGFKYTNPTSSNVISDTPGPGTVPVQLSKVDGVRGTSAPGHYLSVKVGDQPIPEPQAAPTETPTPQAVTPPVETPASTPEASAPITPKVVPPVASPPIEPAKMAPTSRSEAPATALPKDLAKNANPDDGPLKVPFQGGIKPKTASTGGVTPGVLAAMRAEGETVEPPKPAIDMVSKAAKVSKPVTDSAVGDTTEKEKFLPIDRLEDNMRPLIGQAMQLGRLRVGSTAFNAIDDAIRQTHSVTGSLSDDLQKQMSGLLKEPVGKNLTADQIEKLEQLRGAAPSAEPKLQRLSSGTVAERRASDPDRLEDDLNKSMVNMTNALNDPKVPQATKDKIQTAMLATDKNGESIPTLYLKDAPDYPHPTATPAEHPEAPFTAKQLGHPIAPLNLENTAAALGKQPRDLFHSTSKSDPFVTPEERAKLADLYTGTAIPMRQDFGLQDLVGGTEEDSGSGSIIKPAATASPEYAAYEREIRQTALARKLADVTQTLKSKVGEWNQNRPGPTPLTDQLSKLPAEARKYLPEELFDYEKANTGAAPAIEQPIQAARKTSAKPTVGQATPVEGITTTKYDVNLQKKFPDAMQHVPLLQEGIADKYAPAERQAIYNRVMQTYHDGVLADDTFALKKAMDIVVNKGEAGFLDIGSGKGDALYTPEQHRALNMDSADRILSRWEDMSPSTLIKKREGLWKGDLQRRIDGSAPVATDPEIRQEQADAYNELLDRHQALKMQAGNSSGFLNTMHDWMANFTSENPAPRMMRQVMGQTRRDIAIMQTKFNAVDQLFEGLTPATQDHIWDHMQNGTALDPNISSLFDPRAIADYEKQHGPLPDINDLVDRTRQLLDSAREKYAGFSGNLQEFITNYMPGMYENQGRAKAVFASGTGRRPLAGNADFLKQKIYESQREALNQGLQPVTSNPVRAAMLMWGKLEHASQAYEMKDNFVKAGLAQFYKTGEDPPTNWVALDDRMFGSQGLGQYFAQPNVARTFNNYTSLGLNGKLMLPYTKYDLYTGLRSMNNLQNMAQLSFSLFHASDIAANSMLTSAEIGFRRIVNQGLLNVAKESPVARLKAGLGGIGDILSAPAAPFKYFRNGRNVELQFHDPEKMLGYDQTTADLETANANVRPYIPTSLGDAVQKLQQVQLLKNSWQQVTDNALKPSTRVGALVKSIIHTAGTVPELSNYPLMGRAIPAAKLGAMDAMFEQVHREYAGEHPDIINAALQKAADSIDDRFGEINKDNLFWNGTSRDIATILSRSFGWLHGTIRQLGGGVADIGKNITDATQGKQVRITDRTAYVGAMVAGTMMFNGILQYLRTGEKPQGVDYFYPKDGSSTPQGEANRVYPKFLYTYDAINWQHDPLQTAMHKVSPGFATLNDIRRNQDYYHTEIRDPGASWEKNTVSAFAYIAKGYQPFSVANAQESQMRGSKSRWDSVFGILPAPRWAGRTKAENLSATYFQGTQGDGPQSPQVLERKKAFIDLRNKVAQGTVTDDQIQDAVDSGKVNPQMIKYLYESKSQPILVTNTQNLRDPGQVWNIWNAASDEEKKVLLPTVYSKMIHLTSGKEQEEYLDKLQDYSDKHPD